MSAVALPTSRPLITPSSRSLILPPRPASSGWGGSILELFTAGKRQRRPSTGKAVRDKQTGKSERNSATVTNCGCYCGRPCKCYACASNYACRRTLNVTGVDACAGCYALQTFNSYCLSFTCGEFSQKTCAVTTDHANFRDFIPSANGTFDISQYYPTNDALYSGCLESGGFETGRACAWGTGGDTGFSNITTFTGGSSGAGIKDGKITFFPSLFGEGCYTPYGQGWNGDLYWAWTLVRLGAPLSVWLLTYGTGVLVGQNPSFGALGPRWGAIFGLFQFYATLPLSDDDCGRTLTFTNTLTCGQPVPDQLFTGVNVGGCLGGRTCFDVNSTGVGSGGTAVVTVGP